MKLLLAVLSGLLVSPVAIVVASAQTKSTANVESLRVAYGDLDIRTSAGADRLLRRIRYAARQSCDAREGALSTCMRDTVGRAVGEVGSAFVAARYDRDTLAIADVAPVSVEAPASPIS